MQRHAFLQLNVPHLPVRTRPFVDNIVAAEVEAGLHPAVFDLYDRARQGNLVLPPVVVVEETSQMESQVEEVYSVVREAERRVRERMASRENGFDWESIGGKRTLVSLAVAMPVLIFAVLSLTDLPRLPVISAGLGAGLLVVAARALDRMYALRLGPRLRTTGRFAFTTAMIFAVLFVGMNFSAYWERAQFFFRGGLSSADNKDTKILQQLLPTKNTEAVAEPTVAEQAPAPRVDLRANLAKRQEELTFRGFSVAPPDDRLIIPKLGKNIPIVIVSDSALVSQDWGELEKEIQGALQRGVVHYPGTALPGEFGNVFITGHSSYYAWDSGHYKSVFALLDQLAVGDQVIVYSRGQKYVYTLASVEVVSPERTDVLSQPVSESVLTLMTCTPVGTAKNRLIERFKQVSPDPSKNRYPNPNDGSRISNLAA